MARFVQYVDLKNGLPRPAKNAGLAMTTRSNSAKSEKSFVMTIV